MNIYFFCDRISDPKMVSDPGESITEQFKGTINNIYRRGNQITFSEALCLGGQTINICHMIPAESIVVVEEPILLQPCSNTEIATLLILQTTQETGAWGFEHKTQSWHRIFNLFEHSESVWIAPFLCPQVASVSAANNELTPKVTSTNVTQKRRESPWSALEAIWLTTIGLAIFTCLAIGLRLKQPSPYPEVKHSNFRILEDAQPIRPSPNLGSTN